MSASAPSWLKASTAWYVDPSRFSVPLAANGPANWPRGTAATRRSVVVPRTEVRDIATSAAGVSFTVSRLGTPVEVAISYFPNWHVAGALGPYRVTPNLMVVVPTSHEVTLTYGATPANRLGEAISLGALLACAVLFWRGRRQA
jgi:hypothetical protein